MWLTCVNGQSVREEGDKSQPEDSQTGMERSFGADVHGKKIYILIF